jgi:hypothetical protein
MVAHVHGSACCGKGQEQIAKLAMLGMITRYIIFQRMALSEFVWPHAFKETVTTP